MKKTIFMVLALALTFGVFQDSWAAGRTSVSLNNANILSNNIERSSGGVPIGTIITWNSHTLPTDGDWLKCDGSTISALAYPEYASRFGTKLPDYRGQFLRGYGGNSGALGVKQGESVYIGKDQGATIKLGAGWRENQSYTWCEEHDNTKYLAIPGYNHMGWASFELDNAGVTFPFTIETNAKETRPANM